MSPPPLPGVPDATWRMNTALTSPPLLTLTIHTIANPTTGTEALQRPPLQPLLQLTSGTTTARASLTVCEDQVPLGSAAIPAAIRAPMPLTTALVFTPGSAVSLSPTLTVHEHPDWRFC